MLFGFASLSATVDRRHPQRAAERKAPGRPRSATPRVEQLDPRQLLAVVTPSVLMLSASTLDSQGVTITYNVETPRTAPITLAFDRSTDALLSTDDVPVEPIVALPGADSSGASTTSVGVHTVTVPIPGGLPLNPKHPYVLVVANPVATQPGDTPSTASFRTHTIGVVTHGGIQYSAWKKTGPPWTLRMAQTLRDQGYDKVIAYNWVLASNTPGAAAKQGPILAKRISAASRTFPVSDPVDVQFIGHSEGAVVNTQAIVALAKNQTPQLKAGYWQDTLLDPHAANPDTPGRQYSVAAGPIGAIAKLAIDNYQARARDPLAFVPDRINNAQVFYQQTPANRDHNQNGGIYNLWGEVPVRGNAAYFNLTGSGIVHSGKHGVYTWYQDNVVPTLGNGAPALSQATLTGSNTTPTTPINATTTTASSTPVAPVGDPSNPTFAGKAEPGATVFVRAGASNTNHLQTVAQAVAGADGTWSATITANLPAGKYRVIASSRVTNPIAGNGPVIATVPLGSLVINPTYRSHA